MEVTELKVAQAVSDALQAASEATQKIVTRNGNNFDCCGFAWVTTFEKGTSKLVRELKKHGFKKAYGGGYQLWNPSKSYTQSMYALEEGARAAANVLTERLGVEFYAQSRMD